MLFTFQCQDALLIRMRVEPGPTVLAVCEGLVVLPSYLFLFSGIYTEIRSQKAINHYQPTYSKTGQHV